MSLNGAATLHPPLRYVAILLGAILGLGLVSGGILAFRNGQPLPLASCLVIAGALQVAWSGFIWRGSRAAWAFSISQCATLAVVLLFAAPRLRDGLGIPIGLALLPFALFGLNALLLSLEDLKESAF